MWTPMPPASASWPGSKRCPKCDGPLERRDGDTGQVWQPGTQPVKVYDFCGSCKEGFPTYGRAEEGEA